MKILLILLLSIIACASTIAGILLIIKPTGEILQLPQLNYVKPLNNYLIPGMLLVAIIGGISWTSVFFNLTNHIIIFKLNSRCFIIKNELSVADNFKSVLI